MNRRASPLMMGWLLLLLGCGGDPTGPVLQHSELCSDHGNSAIATFGDAALEAEIRGELGIGSREDLTCGLISRLGSLQTGILPGPNPITSLVGIQNLTGLTTLDLRFNSITDISPLSGLTNLTILDLSFNSITDISALSGLTSLTTLELGFNSITDISALSGLMSLTVLELDHNSITDISALSGLTSLTELRLNSNSITDISALSGLTSLTQLILHTNHDLSNIQPLLDNTGLGAGDTVDLRDTNLSCTDVATLEAKGVSVDSDCP